MSVLSLIHFLLLTALVMYRGVTGTDIRITSVSDFSSFVNNVNSGIGYSGTTVYLESDLSFSNCSSFNPIGNYDNHFNGTFDGQGHVISNLALNSSLKFVGLFGYSDGLTIKNVVLDSTCPISSSYNSSVLYVGGIIGRCESISSQCLIENCVNMADIFFDGSLINNLFIGGIAGYLYSPISSSHNFTVKNCGNYGSLVHSGRCGGYGELGGIVGLTEGYRVSNYGYIQNCFNYGSIIHSGTSEFPALGGISAIDCSYTVYHNCLSAGRITMSGTSTNGTRYTGSIMGYINYDSTLITYCYFTGNVGVNDFCSANSPSLPSSTTGSLSTPIKIDSNLVSKLNSQSKANGWDNWFTLHLNEGKINTLNQDLMVVTQKYFPNPVKEDNSFLFWCNTNNCTEKYDPKTTEITSVSDLYAHWKIFSVTLDFGNGTNEVINVTYGEKYGKSLLTEKKEGYTFAGWFDDKNVSVSNETIVSIPHEHTLYAYWYINQYTLIFDLGNGTVIERVFKYNEIITYPENITREECIFIGWNSTFKFMPSYNLTITAQWTINQYFLTFDFNSGIEPEVRVLDFNSTIAYPEDPEKEGYIFIGWNSTFEFMPSYNLTVTAQWIINQYTLIFDLGNKTVIEKVFYYNEIITYPENITREGYIFIGWDKIITNMPASNTTIKALWSNQQSGYSLGSLVAIIAAILISFIIIVIVAIILIVFLRKKKNTNKGGDANYTRGKTELSESLIAKEGEEEEVTVFNYRRVVSETTEEVESDIVTIINKKSILSHLYPQHYERPSMRDALFEAELTHEKIDLICSACENVAHIISNEGKLVDGFTVNDAAAVAMYTYDFGSEDFESNPYRIINRSLVGRNFADLQKISGMLYLVMTALRKLPRVTGIILYRGVRSKVNMDKDHYYQGNIITWSALSSTSPDIETTKKFLAKGHSSKKTAGTMFIINDGWGYNIQPYSLFSDEAEVLLEPERQFRVNSVIQDEGMTFINLQMLETPLSLPHVFGSEW